MTGGDVVVVAAGVEGHPSCIHIESTPDTLAAARDKCYQLSAPQPSSDTEVSALEDYKFWHLATYQRVGSANGTDLQRLVSSLAAAHNVTTPTWTGAAIIRGAYLWLDDSPWTGPRPSNSPAAPV